MVRRDDGASLLVRAPNWIGDAVMCLPALDAVHRGQPDRAITILAKPWVAPLFYCNPAVTAVIEYDARGEHRGALGRWHLTGEIRRRRFDRALLFQNAFEAALIAFLARIPERCGYTTDGRGLLLTEGVRPPGKEILYHHVDYYLDLVERTGLGGRGERSPRLYLEEAEIERGRKFLRDRGVDVAAPLIGIAPGAAYGPAKQWPAERFAHVVAFLSRERPLYPLLFGSRGDQEACRCVGDGIGTASLDLSGKTSLREAMALMSLCTVIITNDSGLMHVAAALGVPTVAIFGSTDPDRTGPLGKRCTVLYQKVDCSPCFKRECPTDFRCMERIAVEAVAEAAMKLIGRGAIQ
ncbi:MAG: lipopolysaccharide heptosyltransferase II [Deltaproteobacteria bacterium]|nr:lipopolysaccharide heptosyltransferase II [Deltaproteobacteria bacterium]